MNELEFKEVIKGIRALNEPSSKPCKPLTSKAEEYKDRLEPEALERGEDIETGSAYLLEPPRQAITDKQRKHLKGASTQLGNMWIRN